MYTRRRTLRASFAELLRQRVVLVYEWYRGMVNSDTGMLEYLYLPESDRFVHERSPIRDIASIWDVALVSEFLERDDLRGVIQRSVTHYLPFVVPHDGFAILDPMRLQEPSSIAHSAFMSLALIHASATEWRAEIASLAEGIIRQQQPDGSYKIYFDDLPDSGEELYAGEAMLALLESFRALGDPRCLASAERGMAFYDAGYFQSGAVTDDMLIFFANWQSQAGRLLIENTKTQAVAQQVTRFLHRMHDRIIDMRFFDEVERQPDMQDSVAVACALEGLNDAYAIARASQGSRVDRYRKCICSGLDYLLALQCTSDCTRREQGGFGMTRYDRTQRIDVTGHAVSAFMKSMENGIDCD